MPTDRTMPPADAMPTPETSPAGGTSPAAMTSGDSEMVSIPKQAFDMLHTLITQLAQGVDAVAQAAGSQAPTEEATPAAPMVSSKPEAGASDEEFLKSIAQEGSKR